jgi:hypothetical protein
VYECEEYPGDLEPNGGRLGAARVVVRATGCAMAKGFGGGTIVCGDPPLEPVGDARIVVKKPIMV